MCLIRLLISFLALTLSSVAASVRGQLKRLAKYIYSDNTFLTFSTCVASVVEVDLSSTLGNLTLA
jgi:hypothetical protein